MIDLTNENHKRGVMILNSKDVRNVDRYLFDWKIHTGCAENYVDVLIARTKTLDVSDSVKESMLSDLGFILDWIKKSAIDIDKAREVFR